jgi:hypothetical protein
VSGDGDFAPAIRALQDKGVRCEVISFRPNTSSDLIAVADEFIDIMKIAGIGRNSKEAKAQRGMSAPEMPAKEVVPEFGFREASPHVAQAALAALREGRGETTARTNGSGRGRGRRRTAEAAPEGTAEAAEEVAPSAVADDGPTTAEGEARKRRRRRGGRGRGRRGRGTQAGTSDSGAAEVGEPDEIGWVELDDLAQLEGLDDVADLAVEREYSFEEADEATLAELGLSPESSAGAAEAEPVEEKKPTRRRATRKQPEPAGAEPDAAEATNVPAEEESAATESAATKKPARRRTTKRAAAGADDAEEKPKPARSRASGGAASRSRKTTDAAEQSKADAPTAKPSRRRATKKDESPEAEGKGSDTEGIWQRFRSARGSSRSG